MKKLFFIAFVLCFTSLAHAQWRDTKHHAVLSAMLGGSFGLGSSTRTDNYQFLARGMYYPRRIYAIGAEAGFSSATGQYNNFDLGAINGFLHLKLPLGFYGEGGVGVVGALSDGRSAQGTNTGFFWSAGFAKSLGSRLALDIQYRNAPKLSTVDYNNLQRGLRFGLSFKI